MKLVFLDRKSIGEDIDFSPFLLFTHSAMLTSILLPPPGRYRNESKMPMLLLLTKSPSMSRPSC